MTTAILQVSRGEFYFSQNMAPYLRTAIIGEEIQINIRLVDEEIQGKSLTPKEIEIIELIAKGLHNREIASTLGIKTAQWISMSLIYCQS